MVLALPVLSRAILQTTNFIMLLLYNLYILSCLAKL